MLIIPAPGPVAVLYPSWTKSLYNRDLVQLGYKTAPGPGAGMINMGNTCYLNSTLQALFHTPSLVNYLRSSGHESECSLAGFSSCTICILSSTLRQTLSSHVMKPAKIYDKLKMICKHLVHGRQEDAHEFLRYLIESLQKCYLTARKVPKSIDTYSKETTPFNQIFGGYMRQDVHCNKCRFVSTTFQHFMDILLDIRQSDNIESALNGYFKKESLGQGENMYKCEKCKQKVPAWKQYKIERPPLVLCVQLKRFNLIGGKNGRPVTLTRTLDISQHVRWAGPRHVDVQYKLVSLITHVGPSPNCGHYTAIGQAGNGTFYRFDDSSVHPTSVQNVLNTSAYVIFYEMLPQSKAAMLAAESSSSQKSSKPSSSSSTTSSTAVIGPQKMPPRPPSITSSSSSTAASTPRNLPKVIGSGETTSGGGPNKLGVVANKKPTPPPPAAVASSSHTSSSSSAIVGLKTWSSSSVKSSSSVINKVGLVPYDG